MTEQPVLSDVDMACIELIGRCGIETFEIRYSDDQEPIVWMAIAVMRDAGPVAEALGQKKWDAAAGQTPGHAIGRLTDQMIDGGKCRHCNRPTGYEPGSDTMPMNDFVCWYQYDPSTKKIVKGCA